MQEFELGSSLVRFGAAEENYKRIRVKFRRASTLAGGDFAERYSSLFADAPMFATALERISAEYLNRTVNTAIAELIEHEIFDIDDLGFIRHYSANHLTWMEDIEAVRAAYNAIALEGGQLASDAASGGGGIMGGGFGMEGAAKGIAIATAANAAIGVATGLIRSAGDGLNAFANKQRMAKLIATPAVVAMLRKGIENLVFNTHRSIVDLIQSARPEWEVRAIGIDDEARCEAILCNVRRGRFAGRNLESALEQAILVNPYCNQAYSEWHKHGLPATNGITNLAAYLGIEVAESAPPEESNLATISRQSTELKAGLLNILKEFQSSDFYVTDQIQARKSRGATAKYFNREFFASIEDSGLTEGQELGELLALIDSTALGSAEEGFAISELGIVWKEGSYSGAYTWEEFCRRGLKAETGMLTIKIGDKKTLNGSQVKNALLVALINNLAGFYRSSQLAI